MNKPENFSILSQFARQQREQAEYETELRAIIEHCTAAKLQMRQGALLLGNRAHLWAHLCDAIDLAEREMERIRG